MAGVIVNHISRPPSDVVDAFSAIGSAEVYDAVEQHNVVDPRITAITDTTGLYGTAVTVRLRNENNILVHVAYELAEAGDVVVIETDGMRRAAWGDTYVDQLVEKGIRGGIVDGYIRDGDGFSEAGVPMFCRGTTPRGPLNPGLLAEGSVNVPVTVGGARIHPGDIVVGDGDGIAVVPREDAEAVLESAQASLEGLAETRDRLDNGESFLDIRDLNDLLDRSGLTEIEGPVEYGAESNPDRW